jgi:hypothetical protein
LDTLQRRLRTTPPGAVVDLLHPLEANPAAYADATGVPPAGVSAVLARPVDPTTLSNDTTGNDGREQLGVLVLQRAGPHHDTARHHWRLEKLFFTPRVLRLAAVFLARLPRC